MPDTFFDDQSHTNIDFTINGLPEGEYNNCNFEACNLEGVNLSKRQFVDCEFVNCNLSNVQLDQTTFRDANFTDCKLLGPHSLMEKSASLTRSQRC